MPRRSLALSMAFVVAASLVPYVPTTAHEPLAHGSVQVVGMAIVRVPPGVELPELDLVDSDHVGTEGLVTGNCGWASMWVHTAGPRRARFEADAGSLLGIMVRVDWTISWTNLDTGAGGGWSETTWQISPTWGVDRETMTGPGLVYGTLVRLIATHWNGVVCQGLVPWDWEQVP